ncbi:hypothetical protein ONZ45_g17525 [Pleurotus djamor]|nr:hypothetical protein ONZ45_g17525 [Pleurotus djamor]
MGRRVSIPDFFIAVASEPTAIPAFLGDVEDAERRLHAWKFPKPPVDFVTYQLHLEALKERRELLHHVEDLKRQMARLLVTEMVKPYLRKLGQCGWRIIGMEKFVAVQMSNLEKSLVQFVSKPSPQLATALNGLLRKASKGWTHDSGMNEDLIGHLASGQWLNMSCIDILVELALPSSNSEAMFISSGAWNTLIVPAVQSGEEKAWDKVFTRNRKGERFALERMQACRRILVPIHRDDHFALMVLSVRDGVVTIYDSLSPKDSKPLDNKYRESVKYAIAFAERVALRYPILGWKNPTYRDPAVRPPQQENFIDCGIFVVIYARHLLNHATLDGLMGGHARRSVVDYRWRWKPSVWLARGRQCEPRALRDQGVDHYLVTTIIMPVPGLGELPFCALMQEGVKLPDKLEQKYADALADHSSWPQHVSGDFKIVLRERGGAGETCANLLMPFILADIVADVRDERRVYRDVERDGRVAFDTASDPIKSLVAALQDLPSMGTTAKSTMRTFKDTLARESTGFKDGSNQLASMVVARAKSHKYSKILLNFLTASFALSRFLHGEWATPSTDGAYNKFKAGANTCAVRKLELRGLVGKVKDLFVPLHAAATVSPLVLLSGRAWYSKGCTRSPMVQYKSFQTGVPSIYGNHRVESIDNDGDDDWRPCQGS